MSHTSNKASQALALQFIGSLLKIFMVVMYIAQVAHGQRHIIFLCKNITNYNTIYVREEL